MNSGIYKIVNKVDNKVYIGQSIDLKKRQKSHFNNLIKGTHQNIYLQNAFNKYGIDNFYFEIIEKCDKDELNNKEIYYINYYDSLSRNKGYNIQDGGNSSSPSLETKIKLMKSKSKIDICNVVFIKEMLASGVDRKIIRSRCNISKGNLDAIASLSNFKLVAEDLNNNIVHKKRKEIDERNKKIYDLLIEGLSNKDIIDRLQVSISMIEKVKYKYPEIRNRELNIRKENYDIVQNFKNKGYNPNQISKMTGIPSTTVYRYYKNEVNPYNELPCKKVNKDIINKVVKLYHNYNQTEISSIVGLSRTTVKNIIDNYEYANTEITD